MKTILLSLFSTLALSLSALAQAPIGPGAIKLSKIIPSIVKSPEYQVQGIPAKRTKASDWLEVEVEFEVKVEEIDELTFAYTIMIDNKLVDGSVTHVNIQKGRERYSVVYIAPRSLEKLTGGHPLTKESVQNVWVVVTRQGLEIARDALKNVAIPNMQHLTGFVLNKNETPYAPLFYDRYEAIKAMH